jgi:hypothetical protein
LQLRFQRFRFQFPRARLAVRVLGDACAEDCPVENHFHIRQELRQPDEFIPKTDGFAAAHAEDGTERRPAGQM